MFFHRNCRASTLKPPTILAPLFGEVGKNPPHTAKQRDQRVNTRRNCLCTRKNNNKVPASRNLALECVLQHHTKCAQGTGKVPHNRKHTRQHKRSLLGANKSTSTQTQLESIRPGGIKTTRLPLAVAKYKGSTTQRVNSICHECIKTARLLLGVAKYKESHASKEKIAYDMGALRPHAYSWASKNTRGPQRKE